MKHTDIRGELKKIVPAEKDAKGKRIGASLEILVGKEKVCCAFDCNVPAEYLGLQVWYQQWESGWFSKKVRQELMVYEDGKFVNAIALQYPDEPERTKHKVKSYIQPNII